MAPSTHGCQSENHSVPLLSKEHRSRGPGLAGGRQVRRMRNLACRTGGNTGTDRCGGARTLPSHSPTPPLTNQKAAGTGILLYLPGKEKAALSNGHRPGERSNISNSDKTSSGWVWLGSHHGDAPVTRAGSSDPTGLVGGVRSHRRWEKD